MKKIILLFAAVAMLAACGKKMPSTGTFGDQSITADGATAVADFMNGFTEGEKNGKITGTINKVCQGEGCWYTYDLGEGKNLRVITKDHSFSLPKDASSKTAIAQGVLKTKTTDVERLKHLAKDEGLGEEEIAKITEPKVEYEFEATGVIIK
jgi:ABC-type phosphate transport system substrate-binding protein